MSRRFPASRLRLALLAALALAALLMAALSGAAARAEGHTVEYFYRNYCESCDPEGEFAEQFRGLTGLELSDCDYTGWNVVRQDGQAAYEAALAAHGLESASLPLVIVDGEVYQGAAQINSGLPRDALQWHVTTDSEVLYLFVPACESCARAEAALDALPESVTLQRGGETVKSRVVVTRVDISADPDYAQALFEAYGVPDERRVSPIAFYGGSYLAGADAIERSLVEAVRQGRAAGGLRYAPQADAAEAPALSLAGAVAAGLVAGFNPCALSMLLLFISLVLESRRGALPVACFLGAKLACYLLIGFALLALFQQINPHWLRPLARWIMTLLGGGLVLLNLSDAWHARRGDLGNVRNQLPGRLRGGLQRVIRALTRRRVLLPAAIALGFIVAGGEFLCAGQLYLMQLLGSARTGGGLPVLLYCLAFLLPSAAISAIVLGGKSSARVSLALAKNLAAVKLITAVAMLALIVAAWVI